MATLYELVSIAASNLLMTNKRCYRISTSTHKHEEKLRAESMRLIHADVDLWRRLVVVEKAMTVIFGYNVEHTSRSDNEAAVQLLEIRLFNAAASGLKLALSGYYQTAFQQARDIMETASCSITSARLQTKSPCGRQRPGDAPEAFRAGENQGGPG